MADAKAFINTIGVRPSAGASLPEPTHCVDYERAVDVPVEGGGTVVVKEQRRIKVQFAAPPNTQHRHADHTLRVPPDWTAEQIAAEILRKVNEDAKNYEIDKSQKEKLAAVSVILQEYVGKDVVAELAKQE